MAQDGSQDWNGGSGAFSHLLHHTNRQPENYGQARGRQEEGGNTQCSQPGQGNTGTWNGPAPKGSTLSTAATSIPSKTQIQDSILLPGGGRMPLIGYGTYTIKDAEPIRQALEAGYRHIDCADFYGNEEIVGEALKGFLDSDSHARRKLWITSKVWNDHHKADMVRKSCERSLEKLGCGYLDLLLVHWPEAFIPGTQDVDTSMTIEETWQAFEKLVDEGKVRYIGVSNFSLSQVEKLVATARIKPVVNQVELHPLLAQRKLVGTSLRKGVHSVAYSPLAHGKGTLLFDHPAVKQIAEETGRTPAQVVLKWNVQRGVAVVPRSKSKENIAANIAHLFDWELTPKQKAALDAMDNGTHTVNQKWHSWEGTEDGGAIKPSDSY